jgi:pyruvate-formate lyase
MTERVRMLREQSVRAVPNISAERALLVTEAAAGMGLQSAPMRRALTFRQIFLHNTVTILDGELIVGERGPAPKATPTFPEICCHSEEDLRILNSRPKIPYAVDDATQEVYREKIIPFWQGKTLRERIFAEMTQEWKDAYEAGLFTEFMEQRAPGHTVLDDKIYRKGMLDFIAEIDARLVRLDLLNDPEAFAKQEELKAMRICAETIIAFAGRYADAAEALAVRTADPACRQELQAIARNCRRVPAHAPATFWEALQYYWFVHLGVVTELNPWDAFNPGRLDQHLWPFYRRELEAGTLDREGARELLECFWVKFNNQPAPPKVGVTAAESATYTDFANINSGGLRPDG